VHISPKDERNTTKGMILKQERRKEESRKGDAEHSTGGKEAAKPGAFRVLRGTRATEVYKRTHTPNNGVEIPYGMGK